MKKIRALVMVLLATAALGFMGCPSLVSPSGTVKVKIFNNADVPLTVSSITEYCTDAYTDDYITLGSYGQESTISVNGNKEFEIPCSSQSSVYAEKTKIDCLCTSGSSVVYPYAGHTNGTSVTSYNQKTIEYKFSHPSLELKYSDPGTITVVYNFVKTTSGNYVLCMVE